MLVPLLGLKPVPTWCARGRSVSVLCRVSSMYRAHRSRGSPPGAAPQEFHSQDAHYCQHGKAPIVQLALQLHATSWLS